MKFDAIMRRIYADYIMPSRLGILKEILSFAHTEGYRFSTVSDFYSEKSPNHSGEKIFLSRIDVDTDPGTTRIIFKQHQRIGVEATYYFRLRTMDPSLMKAIADSGSEVGYHYEELATFAKRRGIRERDVILDHLEDIRSSFLENFVAFEKALGTKVKTVSAHGDFINRLVGLPNSIIIDETIKSKTKIRIDCDEPALTSSYCDVCYDAPYPHFFHGSHPLDAIRQSKKIILFMFHPKQWRSGFVSNSKENFTRLIDSVKFETRCYMRKKLISCASNIKRQKLKSIPGIQ